MLSDVSDIDIMLKETLLRASVENEEKRQAYVAVTREIIDGHPFIVGECAMPMQTSVCPQCSAPTRGQSHQPVAGMTDIRDFEERFGTMVLG